MRLDTSSAWTMRAAVMERLGSLRTIEVPRPALEARDDVLVRVAAAGVCRTDLETIDGHMRVIWGEPRYPYVPGHETAGWIEAVGEGVRDLEPGTPVVLHPYATCGVCEGCRSGRDTYCNDFRFPGVDAKTWGGFAEYVVTSRRSVVPVPADADLAELASYADAGLTAYHAVRRARDWISPSSTCVVLGVGGVGLFAVQLLRMFGAGTIVCVDADADRARFGLDFGADHSVHSPLDQSVQAVLDIAGAGADLVMDFATSTDSAPSAAAMLRRGGALSMVGGGMTGVGVSPVDVIVKELTVIGNFVGSYSELADLVGLAGAGLKSPYTRYPLDQAATALEDLRSKKTVGRAVLVP